MKVGDWVIHNYGINQIVKMEDGRVREISDGSFSCSSNDLTYSCRPLTLRSKRYAESIAYFCAEMRKLPGSNSLNWPDINRYFCELCLLAIDDDKPKYAEGERNQHLAKAEKFFMQIRDSLDSLPEVDGIRLFRR